MGTILTPTDAHTATVTTPLGAIDVQAQGDRVMYVRAGLNEHDITSDEARAPLDLGRGVTVRIRAHFYLVDDEWTARQPFIYRVDQPGKEPTGRMVRRAVDAIARALGELTTEPEFNAMRAGSQRAKAEGEASSRRATARELRRLADALDVEAYELLNGGRVEYLRGNVNGMDVRTTQVRTAAGVLLPPLKSPPRIYGATDYPDSIRDQRPEDRW